MAEPVELDEAERELIVRCRRTVEESASTEPLLWVLGWLFGALFAGVLVLVTVFWRDQVRQNSWPIIVGAATIISLFAAAKYTRAERRKAALVCKLADALAVRPTGPASPARDA